jgi:hypothetical protein
MGFLVATHLDFSWPSARIAVTTYREFLAATLMVGRSVG